MTPQERKAFEAMREAPCAISMEPDANTISTKDRCFVRCLERAPYRHRKSCEQARAALALAEGVSDETSNV